MFRLRPAYLGVLALAGTIGACNQGECKAVVHQGGSTSDTTSVSHTGKDCIVTVYSTKVDSVGPKP